MKTNNQQQQIQNVSIKLIQRAVKNTQEIKNVQKAKQNIKQVGKAKVSNQIKGNDEKMKNKKSLQSIVVPTKNNSNVAEKQKNMGKQVQKNKNIKLKVQQKQTINQIIMNKNHDKLQINQQVKQIKKCQLFQIQLKNEDMSPKDSSIIIPQNMQVISIKEQDIMKLYDNSCYNSPFLITPVLKRTIIQQNSANNKTQLYFMLQNYKKLKQVHLQISEPFLKLWVLQIFMKLHPNVTGIPTFIKINISNLYICQSPAAEMMMKREQKYNFYNPFRILIQERVKDEKQYLFQLLEFDEQFKGINTFQQLQKCYDKHRYESSINPCLNINNIAQKIIQKMNEATDIEKTDNKNMPDPLSEQDKKWVTNLIKKNPNYFAYVHCRASSCYFDPVSFWQKTKMNPKSDQQQQFILLVIKDQQKKDSRKLVGFYSPTLNSAQAISKQPITNYLSDDSKSSFILSFQHKTVHYLEQSKYAFMCNKQILICIGKCDILVTAFNIKSLSYFPVSYAIDKNNIVTSAASLCTGKNFQLEDINVYRFRTNNQS